jgi:hypothetical protein
VRRAGDRHGVPAYRRRRAVHELLLRRVGHGRPHQLGDPPLTRDRPHRDRRPPKPTSAGVRPPQHRVQGQAQPEPIVRYAPPGPDPEPLCALPRGARRGPQGPRGLAVP